MKFIFLLTYIFLTSQAVCQDCTRFVVKDVDRFTDKVTYSLKYPIKRLSSKKALLLLLDISKDTDGTLTLLCNIKVPGFGCTDKTSKIYFIFNDNSKYDCQNLNDFSCDALLLLFLSSPKEYLPQEKLLLSKLSTIGISAIRISGTSDIYELDLTKDESEKFRQSVKCILDY